MAEAQNPVFPCKLTIDVPFPDARLASIAMRSIRVDKEMSKLVERSLSTVSVAGEQTVLRVVYEATTNRMLRVSVNGFMETLALVLDVMAELDADLVDARGKKV